MAHRIKLLLGLLIVGLVIGAFSVSVHAQERMMEKNILRRQVVDRLQGARLEACQAREQGLKTRRDNLSRLVVNMESAFDSIVTRAENYYQSVMLPAGKSVSNFEALVAEINTKKVAVSTSAEAARANMATFSCDADAPRQLFTQFRLDMGAVKTALSEYRTAIRYLIVALHTANTGTAPALVK